MKIIRKMQLIRMAYDEAAAIIESSDTDLESSLTEEEEEYVREFMRTEVVALLRKKAAR